MLRLHLPHKIECECQTQLYRRTYELPNILSQTRFHQGVQQRLFVDHQINVVGGLPKIKDAPSVKSLRSAAALSID